MNLTHAHKQWRSRPADQRFQNLTDLHESCRISRSNAVTSSTDLRSLTAIRTSSDDIKLVGYKGTTADLTHWSLGQLCSKIGAPASYIRKLPTDLAVHNLNNGLQEQPAGDESALLFNKEAGQDLQLRAIVSKKYTRIWNRDITERLLALQASNPNWTNPKAYKVIQPAEPFITGSRWPVMSTEMEPAGLYASDHDMFSFLIDESRVLDGSPAGLKRGFFVWNSEVGAASFGIMTFLYDMVCGNNIVWGASEIRELKIRHVGDADSRAFTEIECDLLEYSQSSAAGTESLIKRARAYSFGSDREQMLDKLLGFAGKFKAKELTRTRLEEAIDLATESEARYGTPDTLWSVVSGLTEASQWNQNTDVRTKIDRDAGKLLQLVEF